MNSGRFSHQIRIGHTGPRFAFVAIRSRIGGNVGSGRKFAVWADRGGDDLVGATGWGFLNPSETLVNVEANQPADYRVSIGQLIKRKVICGKIQFDRFAVT
jgi:hypothetical protein